jgi:hypothetical protein
MNIPFLGWLENCAVRYLVSSPRVGMVAVKMHGASLTYIARDQSDPTNMEAEPPSMQLERLYHMPAHGEAE